MTEPYYSDDAVTLFLGDCRDVLASLPDASVDACVTDPPYELSSGRPSVGVENCLRWVALEVDLPHLSDPQAECAQQVALRREPLGVVSLRRVVLDVDPGVGVPVGAVDLKGDIANQEVDDAAEPSGAIPDAPLSDVGDPSGVEDVSDLVLKFRRAAHSPFCQGSCACVRELAPGVFGVRVVVSGLALLDDPQGVGAERDAALVGDGVGLDDDTRGEAGGSARVVARPGAELGAMLALNVRNGAFDLLATDGAVDGDEALTILAAQGVGAGARARRLPTVPEADRIGVIGGAAGRALSLDHLTLPRAVARFLSSDRSGGGGFMGKQWDSTGIAYDVDLWRDALRVLKPGGHLLAFGGSRTWHRLVCAIEDAGFEIRDGIAWVYASGFPKSLDVSKAIDKTAGAEREVVGTKIGLPGYHLNAHESGTGAFGSGLSSTTTDQRLAASQITAPATPAAIHWQGWGTALKPAFEPICVARKPLAGTVATNVLAHGTGALNIDGCRVESADALVRPAVERTTNDVLGKGLGVGTQVEPGGRWPSNVALSHAPDCGPDDTPGECVEGCPVRELDEQSGDRPGFASQRHLSPAKPGMFGVGHGSQTKPLHQGYDDSGGASRFFPAFRYEPKAPTDERPRHDGTAHPTVKPLDLMRWLVRLVTPPGGVILEPFAGSGTTCEAAVAEGFRCVAVEQEAAYLPLITQRLTKRSDPVAHLASKGEDLGLFELLDGEA